MRAHNFAALVVLCLLSAGCASDVTTVSAVPPSGNPLHDGGGWVGGGGRSDDSTATSGIGWVGGGGRLAPIDTLKTVP